jgi:hypothetical protein
MGQTRGGRDPRGWRMVALVVALGVLHGAAGCDGDPATPIPTPSPTAGPTGPPVPAAQAPDGGTVRVVEKGLSSMKDRDGKEMVSYGIVVENTSKDAVAVKTSATVRIIDAAGKAITDRTARATDVQREIGVVFPGQRVGIGGDTYVDRPGAATLTIEIGAAMWLPPGNRVIPVAKATAGEVKTEHSGGSAALTFTVTSEYDDLLDDPSAQAVFRDPSGKIVGGTAPHRTAASDQYRPGRSPGRINTTYGTPPGTDDSKTEIYISPFCC